MKYLNQIVPQDGTGVKQTQQREIDMHKAAAYYAQKIGWAVFPVHTPIFDGFGKGVGCSCEHYRRTDQCKVNHPHLYLGATGKCKNPGKCPRVRWGKQSTADPGIIHQWWSKPWSDINVETGEIVRNYPNIGIDCGKSNIFVFDVDSYKENCGDIEDLLSRDDQRTTTVLTGRGGEHLIYRLDGKPYGNSTKGLPLGFDIRGKGGYIVAAPSMHETGKRYSYETGYDPKSVPPIPIPITLEKILSSHTGGQGSSSNSVACPEKLKHSVRIVETLMYVGRINHFGMKEYGNGVKWIIDCPFNPAEDPHGQDAAPFIIVDPDGKIRAGCHHNRCQQRINAAGGGWKLLRGMVGFPSRCGGVK